MTPDGVHFVLLPVDGGPARSGRRGPDESTYQAIRRLVPDLSTQGTGRLRLWFCDRFADLPPNPLADAVIGRLGYRHPTGWYGPVAITMAEDATGDVPPLLPEVRAAIDELIADNGR